MTSTESRAAVFRVLDALDHPHGGRILRLRLQDGEAPSVGELKGARLVALSPEGDARREVEVEGFADLGGKASNLRLARTGRADLRVVALDGKSGPPVDAGWEVRSAPGN